MATKQYEFQPPMNMVAIRSSIMQRIQNKRKEEVLPATPTTPTTTEKTLPRHLDNGLPSPPCDSYEDKPVDSEMVVNALLELSSHSNQQMEPPSPVLSQSKSTPSSPAALHSEAIRQKIKELEDEKHKLFQVMKDLLSQPSPKQEEQEEPKERARSQSREKTSSRPAIRSRSISHSEYRPARYGGNYHRSPSRFYSYDNRYAAYPSSSRSYPLVSPMPRRVPYVSSRPQPPARISSSFRRPDRHLPRY